MARYPAIDVDGLDHEIALALTDDFGPVAAESNDEGRVTLGGEDLRDLSFERIRSLISVVNQDTFLFHGTVEENLRLGRPDATRDQIESAARAANAHDFVTALPDGYATVVGERGARLSGAAQRFTRVLLDAAERRPVTRPPMRHGLVDELSSRELDVLRLVSEGMTDREIAELPAIAEGGE